MKSIKKFLFVMAALAAVWSFVSCSSDDDGTKTVAVYENSYTELGITYTETITFFDDDTFENVGTIAGKKYTYATGTYKGDVTKDTSAENKVTFTIKKIMDDEDSKLYSIEDFIEKYWEDWVGPVPVNETIMKEIIKEEFTDLSAVIEKGVLYCEFGVYKKK